MTEKKLITIGADPEVFLSRPGNRRSIVPAFGLIGGTKKEPRQVLGGWLQEDGVAAEINIPPATTEGEFAVSITTVMRSLRQILGYSYYPVIEPVAQFDTLVLEDPRAQIIGCSEDFNAYTQEKQEIEYGILDTPTRYAGGHIHIGIEGVELSFEQQCYLAKLCDVFLGLPLKLYFGRNQRDNTNYGRFGVFRPKPYGIEYRTPSNEWLLDTYIMKWVFNQAVAAAERAIVGNRRSSVPEAIVKDYETKGRVRMGYINNLGAKLL